MNYSNYENDKVDQLIESGLETIDHGGSPRNLSRGPEDFDGRGALGFHRLSELHHGAEGSIKGLTYYTSNNLRFQDFTAASSSGEVNHRWVAARGLHSSIALRDARADAGPLRGAQTDIRGQSRSGDDPGPRTDTASR